MYGDWINGFYYINLCIQFTNVLFLNVFIVYILSDRQCIVYIYYCVILVHIVLV